MQIFSKDGKHLHFMAVDLAIRMLSVQTRISEYNLKKNGDGFNAANVPVY
jgi:hypothetical protein